MWEKLLAFLQSYTFKWWPNSIQLKVTYKEHMRRKLNLKNPKSYTEKLQWLKIHDRNPLYTTLVDKYEVKNIFQTKLVMSM